MTTTRSRNHLWLLAALILVASVLIVSSLGGRTDPVVGCWKSSGYAPPTELGKWVLKVNANGRYEKRGAREQGTWSRDGSRLVLRPDGKEQSEVFLFEENPRALQSEFTDGIDYLPCEDDR